MSILNKNLHFLVFPSLSLTGFYVLPPTHTHTTHTSATINKGTASLLLNFLLKDWCWLMMHFCILQVEPHYTEIGFSMQSCQKKDTESSFCDPIDLKML